MIGQSGPLYAPRYYIANRESGYWTGGGWNTDRRKAFLFHRSDEVTETLYVLMTQLPGPLVTFTIPLVIEAKTDAPLDLETLKMWLAKAVQIGIDGTHGSGPVPNSMVMIRVDYSQMKVGES
jgi:hypothetical protein